MSPKTTYALLRTFWIASFLACFSYAAYSQSTVLGKGCDLAVFGEKDTKTFLAFDSDLRTAITNQDAGKVALLVQFPLRVDDDKGDYFIYDAASLQGRFQEIFTPEIRQTILQSNHETIWCNYAGVDCGGGRVWVNVLDRGYVLVTVNLPSTVKPKPRVAWEVLLACSTVKHRLIIDMAGDGSLRYRAWDVGHALSQNPDLEITKGEDESGGTGPCYNSAWKFKNGKAEYVLEETGGCGGDSADPPKDAQAQLMIKLPEKPDPITAWCY